MATFHVALNGNDTTGTGSVLLPWRTIAKGLTAVNPGDTLYIRGGTWSESFNLTASGKAGTSTARITLAGYPGDTTIIAPAQRAIFCSSVNRYFTIKDMIWDGINHPAGTNGNLIAGVTGFIFQNLDIKFWNYNSLYIERSTDCIIRNCLLHDSRSTGEPGTRWYGLYCSNGNTNLIMEGCDLYRCPGGGSQIYANPAVSGMINGVIYRNNRFHHNNPEGFLTVAIGGLVISEGSGAQIQNVQFYNNLVYNNGVIGGGQADGIRVGGGTSANSPTNTQIYNNVFYGNAHRGIAIDSGSVGTIIRNNISFGNNQTAIANFSSTTTLSHNLTTNPLFVNPSTFDFHLQSGSPAINAGTTIATFNTDFDGVLRPQGSAWDIGAYEFTGSNPPPPPPPDTTPPAVPTGFLVQ